MNTAYIPSPGTIPAAWRWFQFLLLLTFPLHLLSVERQTMLMFMGGNLIATLCFMIALGLAVMIIVSGFRKKLLVTFAATVTLVYLMTFMRSWVRSSYLREFFNLGDLEVVTEYSPLIFFLVTLVLGVICVVWMLRLTAVALKNEESL